MGVVFPGTESERLRIRPFQLADIDRYLEYRNDPDTMWSHGWTTVAERDVRELIATHATRAWEPGDWQAVAIVERRTGRLVGDVGVRMPGPELDGLLGWTVHPDDRGNGYAAEAVMALAGWLFAEADLPVMRAGIAPRNLASLRVAHRVGFRALGQVVEAATAADLLFELKHDDRPTPAVIGLLTGGKSTRMGRDKATTIVDGVTMAERVAASCRATGIETIVLGPDDAGTGLDHLPDDEGLPGGPLGGLLTLQRARPGADVVLLATDQPFVLSTTIMQLFLQPPAKVVVPLDDGHPQVTCARYGPAVHEQWQQRPAGQGGGRLRDFLDAGTTIRVDEATWRTWGEDGRSFASLDRPADVDAATDRFL